MKKNIALVQFAVTVGDVAANYTRIEQLLTEAVASHPDIIVLPETWNTGFAPTPALKDMADPDGERTRHFLSDFAKKHAVNIVGGSVATVKKGYVYNTTYVLDRQGSVISEYDKIHGFSPAKEEKFFTGGNHIHHFMLDDIPCSSCICYDIRFPELVRTAALQGVDLFFVPAQWPTIRLRHWEILNIARAVENQMFLCAVNGCGQLGKVTCAGNSLLLDPWGEEILHLDGTEQVRTASINLSVLKDIRQRINVFHDRKPGLYRSDY